MMHRTPLATIALTTLIAACSSSKSSEPAPTKQESKDPGEAAGAGATAQKPAPPPPPSRDACPSPVVVDCERLVPAKVRETYLAGKAMALDAAGLCSVGPKDFEVTVGVSPADAAAITRIQALPDQIAGLGRTAGSVIGDKIHFLASRADCEITVKVPNKLAKGIDLARAIDDEFTKATVLPATP